FLDPLLSSVSMYLTFPPHSPSVLSPSLPTEVSAGRCLVFVDSFFSNLLFSYAALGGTEKPSWDKKMIFSCLRAGPGSTKFVAWWTRSLLFGTTPGCPQ